VKIDDTHMLAPMVRKLARRSSLGAAEVDALLALPCRLLHWDRGSYLMREGDPSAQCMTLVSGFAYCSKATGTGARQILSIHLRGDLLGAQQRLLDVADHSVQALTRVVTAHIPPQALLEVAAAHPAITRALWRELMVDGSVAREWLLNVGRRNARQRIAHLLCELALRQEAADLCAGPDYQWPMTQEQIGDATGITSVHVNRTVQGLRRDGIIRVTGQQVTIDDWPQLQAAGDFSSVYLHAGGAPAPVADATK